MRTGTSASTLRDASGGRPALARITGATKAWKVKIAEVGKPGSTTSGLPSTTARQSGLPGLSATPCTTTPGSPSCDTTRCERSPAPFEVPPDSSTMSQTVERGADCQLERDLVVGKAAERHRLAAGLRHRRRDDRAVGIVDRRRPQRLARRHQFVAGREHRDARPPHDVDLGDAAGREHADLARADARAAPQHHLAARDVGAGIGDELARRGGAAHIDGGVGAFDQLGLLDHHDGVGAARHHAAGGDGGGGAGLDAERRRVAADDDLAR